MSVENELKSLRYLINDLILSMYDIRLKLDEIKPSARKCKIPEPNSGGSSIGFDLFTIPKKQYDMLVTRYGIDNVNKACVKLDEFIKINEYIPHGTPFRAIEKQFILEDDNELQDGIDA